MDISAAGSGSKALRPPQRLEEAAREMECPQEGAVKSSAMSFETTIRTPSSECVECRYPVNAVSGPCQPVEGDLTLCIKCGSLNAFTAELKLRQPTLDEYLTVAADSEFQAARKAIISIRRDSR